MRLIALYNIFDAEELLEESIRCIRDHVDCVLAVVQSTSNFGEAYEGGLQTSLELKRRGLVDVIAHYRPFALPPYQNEARKRLLAAELGYKWGFTHFLHVDCDEYYRPEQFNAARRYVEDHDVDGSVASIKTYFRQPDWALQGFDDYFVPFIHRYGREVKPPADGAYPFRCDDTRTIESHNVALLPPDLIVMHHFSWVRSDVERKVRNSSVRGYIHHVGLLNDYQHACPNYLVRHYGRRIEVTPRLFNIPISG